MFGSGWFTIEGFARVAAGLGTVISMAEPIILAVMAWAFLNEPLTNRLWQGMGIALIGAVVLFWPEITASASRPVDAPGVFYILAAAASWGLFTIGAKPMLAPLFELCRFRLVDPALRAAGAAAGDRPYDELLTTTPVRIWAELAYLAAFNSLLGAVLWNFGCRI